MKKCLISILVISLACNGCYASQRDELNTSFQKQRRNLDVDCKPKDDGFRHSQPEMIEWCKTQYAAIQHQHEQDLVADERQVNKGSNQALVITLIAIGIAIFGSVAFVYCNKDTAHGNCK